MKIRHFKGNKKIILSNILENTLSHSVGNSIVHVKDVPNVRVKGIQDYVNFVLRESPPYNLSW